MWFNAKDVCSDLLFEIQESVSDINPFLKLNVGLCNLPF
jgi:hypothetical protein